MTSDQGDDVAEQRGPVDAAEVDLRPLESNLGFLLRIAQVRVFDAFHRHFGAEGLTPARFAVLAVLAANRNVRQVALANALQIKQPNLAVLITAMEADGLVERRADAANRRANMLSLTAQGAALHAEVAEAVIAMDRSFTEHLTDQGRASLITALKPFLQP